MGGIALGKGVASSGLLGVVGLGGVFAQCGVRVRGVDGPGFVGARLTWRKQLRGASFVFGLRRDAVEEVELGDLGVDEL